MSKKLKTNIDGEKVEIEVGTPEEAAWTQIKKGAERQLDEMRRTMQINKKIIELAKEKILLESRK